MLKQFQKFLINKGYKEFSANGSPSTVIDYAWRINKICEQEKITLNTLSKNILKYLELYGKSGIKKNIGALSHESYINSLKHFKEFVLSEK